MKRVLALLLVLSACAPSGGLEVTVRRDPVDITYGRGSQPAVVRPPGADLRPTTFPGFLIPPISLDEDISDPGPPPACPAAGPFAVPRLAAGTTVPHPPTPGTYAFRRQGFLKVAPIDDPEGRDAVDRAQAQPLPAAVERTITAVREQEQASGERTILFDVVQREASLTTTTTYLIDNTSGLYLARVVTERTDLPGDAGGEQGIESFDPQPPVKLVNLPIVRDPIEPGYLSPTQYGAGVDPLTGIQMEVFFRTVDRSRVDACGAIIDAWHVTFNGRFTRHGVRSYDFEGSFDLAPQLGGLIVRDDVRLLDGEDQAAGILFHQESTSTINSEEPTT